MSTGAKESATWQKFMTALCVLMYLCTSPQSVAVLGQTVETVKYSAKIADSNNTLPFQGNVTNFNGMQGTIYTLV